MIKFLDPLGHESLPDAAHYVASAEFILMLRQKGVQSVAVLRAMEQVARLPFMAQKYHVFADKDYEIPLICGQTMLRPSLVGWLLEHLKIEKSHHILLVGAGSGYIAALLAHMALSVTALERFKTLADLAHSNLRRLNFTQINVLCADGLQGYAEKAPYDRILVTFACEDPPLYLRKLLKPDGFLITPFGRREELQKIAKLTLETQALLRPSLSTMSGRAGYPHIL